MVTKVLQYNCRAVQQELVLPHNAASVVEYIVLTQANRHFTDFCDNLLAQLQDVSTKTLLQYATNLTPVEYEQTLKQLARAGILSKPSLSIVLGNELPDYLLQKLLTEKIETKQQLIAPLLHESKVAQFTLDAFPQVDTQLLANYFTSALTKQQRGINLLFYGDSGTGKTELARALAKSAGYTLYEVRSTALVDTKGNDDFDSKYPDKERLRYHSMINGLLSNNSKAVLLVDECESVFEQACYQYSKEHLQRLLEDNSVPSIWITNHVDCLEPSFIRRFKLATEVPPPRPSDIERMCKQYFRGLSLSSQFTRNITRIHNVSPAIIANAAHVAKTMGTARTEAENVVSETVKSTLQAAGLWDNTLRYQAELNFDVSLLNLKQPNSYLEEVSYALKHNKPARILLSGPPGTGKTAFAHYLAEINQRNLIRVKCSDVLSKWVGESEKNVAELFHRAHNEGKVILLDEVDSLLVSRESLSAHYELQLVNELLTQIECFTQPLFAATNFDSRLDKAVLRRFDFKLDCGYLKPEQVIRLYKQISGIKRLKVQEEQQLAHLTQLTPGDFAILARRKQFRNNKNHLASAISLLAEENQRKQPNTLMGFIRPH